MDCDVAVVGGGLAGRLAAHRLSIGGVQALVIDAGAPSPSLGIAAAGGMDSPHRLRLALGEPAARELWGFSRAAVARVLLIAEKLGVEHRRSGSIRASLGPDEAAEWTASAELLRSWFDDDVVAVEPPGADFSGAWRVAGDGWVDAEALAAALPPEHSLSGAARIVESSDGVVLDVDGQRVRAELVIVAAGWAAPAVHPWFKPMLFPVRLQGCSGPAGGVEAPVLARHRFEAWVDGGGRRQFVGCRWAEQPEMEAGVTDATGFSAAVLARQREFSEHHLGAPLDGDPWSGIAAFPCDGLPLLGPLPGNPRVLSLGGWGGWGLSWMAEAAERVVAGVLGEAGEGIPSWLRARRMV